MKSLLLLIIICFISKAHLFSNEDIRIENIRDKIVKNGIVYYKNETIPYNGKFITEDIQEEYLSGIKNGFFKGNFLVDDMKYIYEGNYIEGIKHGEWIIKYPNGQKKAIIKYNYDQPYGKWIYFFENNIVESYENFKNGSLFGETVFFNPRGELIAKVNYKNGLLDGKTLFFYKENTPELEISFINGKAEGDINIFSKGGFQILKGLYKNNKREGTWKFYYQKGELKTIIPYLNGLKNGRVVIYDKGGTLIESMTFKDGMLVDSNGHIDESQKNKKLKDNILEQFKQFNRDLNFIKYDRVLSEI